MTDPTPSFNAQLTVMKMIHGFLALAPVVFGAFVLYMNLTDPTGETTPENELLLYVPAVALVLAFPTSSFLFKSRVSAGLENAETLGNKLAAYQTAHLIRMSLFEMTGLLASVIAFITANNYVLGVLAIVLIMFLLLFPTPAKITLDLNLSATEKELLENG